jgi:hypothetical protein
MPEYRAFSVDADGHVKGRHECNAENDDQAIEVTKQHVDGLDVSPRRQAPTQECAISW